MLFNKMLDFSQHHDNLWRLLFKEQLGPKVTPLSSYKEVTSLKYPKKNSKLMKYLRSPHSLIAARKL